MDVGLRDEQKVQICAASKSKLIHKGWKQGYPPHGNGPLAPALLVLWASKAAACREQGGRSVSLKICFGCLPCLGGGETDLAGVPYFVFVMQRSFASCAPPERTPRTVTTSPADRINFRKPVSLPRTPWDDERNAIDHRPNPSNFENSSHLVCPANVFGK